MKNFFINLPKKYWVASVVGFCAMGDISILKIIYDKLSPYPYFEKIIKLSTQISRAPIRLPEGDLKVLHQIMVKNLEMMILAVVGFHAIIYFLFFLKKKIARSYILALSFTAGVFCFFSGAQSMMGKGTVLEMYLFLQGLLYLFVGIGLLYRKDSDKKLSAGVSGPSSDLT